MFDTEKRIAIGFDKVTLRQTKDGAKIAKMRFRVRLSPDVACVCPKEVRAVYEAIETRENKIASAELLVGVPGVNIQFYTLPDSPALSLSIAGVTCEDLEVEMAEDDDAYPTLLFTVQLTLQERDKLRYWIVDNVFGQMWAQFEIAQMTLAPTITGTIAEEKKIRKSSDKVN